MFWRFILDIQCVVLRLDEIHQKSNQIELLKLNIEELRMKLAQVQQLFETARSERNGFQRDLQATSENRDDLKERLRVRKREATYGNVLTEFVWLFR